jgi:hypothetical protein
VQLSPPRSIVLIGNDSSLTYLIGRYAERSGHTLTVLTAPASADAVRALNPVAIMFPTVDSLRAAAALIADLTNAEIRVAVCSSVADKPLARELGADLCLVHPLTYDSFLAILPEAGEERPPARKGGAGRPRGRGPGPDGTQPE